MIHIRFNELLFLNENKYKPQKTMSAKKLFKNNLLADMNFRNKVKLLIKTLFLLENQGNRRTCKVEFLSQFILQIPFVVLWNVFRVVAEKLKNWIM